MEANLLGKALAAVLIAAAGLYVLLLRPWRPRRMWERRAPAVDLLFLLALAVGFATIHWPLPFARAAVVLVDQTDLPETLAGIDARIHEIEQLPEVIWSDLTARFGWESSPPEPPPPPDGPGVVTGAVLPALTAVVEVIVRAFVYWGSLIVLAVCQVMRIAIGIKRAVASAASGLRADPALEGRVAALEETVVALRAIPEGAGATP